MTAGERARIHAEIDSLIASVRFQTAPERDRRGSGASSVRYLFGPATYRAIDDGRIKPRRRRA